MSHITVSVEINHLSDLAQEAQAAWDKGETLRAREYLIAIEGAIELIRRREFTLKR